MTTKIATVKTRVVASTLKIQKAFDMQLSMMYFFRSVIASMHFFKASSAKCYEILVLLSSFIMKFMALKEPVKTGSLKA